MNSNLQSIFVSQHRMLETLEMFSGIETLGTNPNPRVPSAIRAPSATTGAPPSYSNTDIKLSRATINNGLELI